MHISIVDTFFINKLFNKISALKCIILSNDIDNNNNKYIFLYFYDLLI